MSLHPPAPARTYWANFLTLCVLTVVTWFTACQDLGVMSTPIALGIAVIKAALVVLFFMHVWESTPLTKLVIFASLFILTVLLTFLFTDYMTRNYDVLPPVPAVSSRV